jgi:hypothetical protein
MSTIILPPEPANTEDAKRYANGMAEIRQRLGIARTAVARIIRSDIRLTSGSRVLKACCAGIASNW